MVIVLSYFFGDIWFRVLEELERVVVLRRCPAIPTEGGIREVELLIDRLFINLIFLAKYLSLGFLELQISIYLSLHSIHTQASLFALASSNLMPVKYIICPWRHVHIDFYFYFFEDRGDREWTHMCRFFSMN